MTPEQEALYALQWNVPRSDLSMAGQLEYDRVGPAWARGARPAAGEVEAAPPAWAREHPPAYGQRSPLPRARTDNAATPTGDQVRDTWFWPPRHEILGYDAGEVDDLLCRIAAELDAGRPARPLVADAVFRKGKSRRRYDIDAVDWFLGQFLLLQDHVALAGLSDDPWHDLPVTQLALDVVSGAAKRSALHEPSRRASRGYFTRQCEKAWRDFGQLPGTHLWWGGTGKFKKELRTAEEQTLASSRRLFGETFSAGGRDFTWSSPPRQGWRELVDKETGVPVLYTSGQNYECRAEASIMFPDQRWLRFLVRGTGRVNAIMTAVDETGNRIARYRISNMRSWTLDTVEITVHPGSELTDELALALVISAAWLEFYFLRPG